MEKEQWFSRWQENITAHKELEAKIIADNDAINNYLQSNANHGMQEHK